jgi:SPP1 gp7 family putative phage head morphogenesis protein
LKRSANNERQLEQALSQLFRKLSKEVLGNLEEYWSEYQLLQGQINLMVKPIEEAQEEYYHILERYIRREYKLGNKEAQRLVDLAMTKQAHKSIFDKLRKAVNIKATRYNLFGTLEEAEEELLTKTFIASQRTIARVATDINQIITTGYTSGKGINVVAQMLQTRFNQLETWEAKRIARTEIHNAHNNAVMKTYETLNVEYTQWIAADDDRTRESHVEVDREIIRIGDTYSNGLQYPGDTSGPIEEWINCRCSNAPYVMPYGMMAPPGMEQFREEDLIPISN